MIYLYEEDIPLSLNLGKVIAIDTETLGLDIERDRLCLIQMSSGDGNAHIIKYDPKKMYPNLKKMLSDASIQKIFHFARFDLAILNYTFGINIGNIYCTKIASKIARTYTDKHGLKNLCKDLLGIELDKEEQCSYWAGTELSKEQVTYAANDVLHLHSLKNILDKMLNEEGRLEYANVCFSTLEKVIVPLDLAHFDSSYIFSH